MRSHTTTRFRRCLAGLPEQVRRGLRFKQIHAKRSVYSVRIGIHHRALGVLDGEDIVWFWIGSHADYDALIR